MAILVVQELVVGHRTTSKVVLFNKENYINQTLFRTTTVSPIPYVELNSTFLLVVLTKLSEVCREYQTQRKKTGLTKLPRISSTLKTS